MASFRRNRTEHVGSFHVFDLFRHEMIDRDGRPMRDAYTFACPDWVSVVPVTEEGSFVLVRQYRHGIDAPTLEVPGGIIEKGQDPADAAGRELREETGYGGGTLVSLGASLPNPALQNNWHHMFLARGVRRLGDPEFDVGEFCEVIVVPETEIRARIRTGEINHALVLLALARAFEVLAESGSRAEPR